MTRGKPAERAAADGARDADARVADSAAVQADGEVPADAAAPASAPRQRVVKTGARRARLTPVAGTDLSPETPELRESSPAPAAAESGKLDEHPGARGDADTPPTPQPRDAREAQMLRDKPPHWG